MDELGRATYFYYDKAGRRRGTVDAEGNESYYVYDAASNTVAQVDALGNATYFLYDALNRQEAQIDALGGASYFHFDAVGNRNVAVDALGEASYFAYDALNRLAVQTDPVGATSYYQYDAASRRTATIDPLGNPTYFEYDLLGRQIAVTNALGQTSQWLYDAAGQQTARIDPRGYPTYLAYDLAGRQQAATDALGYASYFWYDLAGRQTAQIPPDGASTYFQYDALGRQTSATDALGHASQTVYDAAGQRTASVDACGHVSYFEYDSLGRLQCVRNPADGLVYYSHDSLGRLIAFSDPLGYTSYFAYDPLGRLTVEANPLGNIVYYVYDALGRLVARKDGKGQTASFQYDAAGRQTAASYAGVEPIYFTYDLAGNMTTMLDEWGTTYWDYDPVGRPTRRHDPRGTVVDYAYGAGGQRTELTVEGQGTVYYEYGPTGNMDWLLDGKTGLFTYYQYDAAGRVILQHHPNACTTYLAYDLAGRLSEKVTKKDADGSVLVRFAYARDAGGDPISIEREAELGVFYYAYDALQRLTYEGQFVASVREYENYYEYDPSGNRTLLRHGETDADNLTYYDYNAASELTLLRDRDGWTYFAYDANGNTIQEQTPAYTRYYDWDGRDMMSGVRSTEPGWTDNEYRYDGMSSRVSTLESTGFSYYDWDSITVLQEKTGDGAVTDRQVHGYAPISSIGDIALMDKSGEVFVPMADQVGTIWNLLGPSGTKPDSYVYDSFGVSRSVTEMVANSFRFGTRRSDADVGMCHFLLRQYRPLAGVFERHDPLFLFGLFPPYQYCNSNPTHCVDPTGLLLGCVDECCEHGERCRVVEVKALLAFHGGARARELAHIVFDKTMLIAELCSLVERAAGLASALIEGSVAHLASFLAGKIYEGLVSGEKVVRPLPGIEKRVTRTLFNVEVKLAYDECEKQVCFPCLYRKFWQWDLKKEGPWHTCHTGNYPQNNTIFFPPFLADEHGNGSLEDRLARCIRAAAAVTCA